MIIAENSDIVCITEVFTIPIDYDEKLNRQEQETVLTVSCSQNESLRSMQVSFHWWDEGYTSLHRHDHYEFFIITSGTTRHELNGNMDILSENTLHLIRPEEVHRFTPVDLCKSTHINFAATVERFDLICSALGISKKQLLEGNSPLRFELSSNEMDFFIHRAQQLSLHVREKKRDSCMTQMIISEMLIHAISVLYKRHPMRLDNRPAWFVTVLRQLHAPEMMDCKASDVYRMAGYCAPVVIKQFKKHTGETVSSYLVKLKIDWAITLLNTTDMTVSEISQTLGYSGFSHFCKLFRSHTGKTPGQYRNASNVTTVYDKIKSSKEVHYGTRKKQGDF